MELVGANLLRMSSNSDSIWNWCIVWRKTLAFWRAILLSRWSVNVSTIVFLNITEQGHFSNQHFCFKKLAGNFSWQIFVEIFFHLNWQPFVDTHCQYLTFSFWHICKRFQICFPIFHLAVHLNCYMQLAQILHVSAMARDCLQQYIVFVIFKIILKGSTSWEDSWNRNTLPRCSYFQTTIAEMSFFCFKLKELASLLNVYCEIVLLETVVRTRYKIPCAFLGLSFSCTSRKSSCFL